MHELTSILVEPIIELNKPKHVLPFANVTSIVYSVLSRSISNSSSKLD